MKNTVRMLIISSLFILLQACTPNPQMVQHDYQTGQALYQQKNYSAAFQRLITAARGNNANAQYAVGYMLYNGIGVPRHQADALLWFQKAAQQGQLQAIEALQRLNNGGA